MPIWRKRTRSGFSFWSCRIAPIHSSYVRKPAERDGSGMIRPPQRVRSAPGHVGVACAGPAISSNTPAASAHNTTATRHVLPTRRKISPVRNNRAGSRGFETRLFGQGKRAVAFIAAVVVTALTAASASAAPVHFAKPVFVDHNLAGGEPL